MFACLDRYRASDHVARGVVMKPAVWLLTGHRDEVAVGLAEAVPKRPERNQ